MRTNFPDFMNNQLTTFENKQTDRKSKWHTSNIFIDANLGQIRGRSSGRYGVVGAGEFFHSVRRGLEKYLYAKMVHSDTVLCTN